LHSAGKFGRAQERHFRPKPDGRELGESDLPGRRPFHAAPVYQTERDILPNIERIEQGAALEEHAEFLQQAFSGGVRQSDRLGAIYADRTRFGMQQAEDALDQNRFSRARPADHDKALAAAAVDLEAVQYLFTAERFAQSPDRDFRY
jgi:hypothetical protein